MSDDDPAAVLHTPSLGSWRLRRWAPPTSLGELVGVGWTTEWSLPEERTHLQAALPHPCANLVVEDGALTFHGPVRARFDRTLRGSGRVVGVRFRPGVLRALTGRPAADSVDRAFPGTELGLPADLADRVGAEGAAQDAVAVLLDALGPALTHDPDPVAIEMRDAVELAERDETVRSVDDLAARTHRSRRTLQRLFTEHVGLGPSWVIRRYRMHRTLEHAGDAEPDWAAIAHRVGYYDQAHLVRDFTGTVGLPPGRYRRSGSVGNG